PVRGRRRSSPWCSASRCRWPAGTASWLEREDRAGVHDAAGVERVLQGREQVVSTAVLLLDPGRAVLADPVVVHHRAARPQGLFDDDRVQRLVVDLDLLARAAPDL